MTPRPSLCATVTGSTMAELRARRDSVRDADLVELRLDTVQDPDVPGALQGRRGPVLLTCRSRHEGGAFRGSEEERHRILAASVASEADYVDIEWSAAFDDLVRARGGRGVVLSTHDFSGVPADLSARARDMARAGCEVVKIAVAVTKLAENVTLLRVADELRPCRSVVLGMGEAGLPSRVFAARFGSCWSYAGDAVAPGQVTCDHMVREYGFRRIQAGTALYGLWGRPLGHSLSPAMHNAAFASLGADAAYVPLAAADVEDLAAFAAAFRLAGASVTAPFKTAVLQLGNAAASRPRGLGAANTVTWTPSGPVFSNTDVEGFLAPLAGEPVKGWRVAVLGHGGAARAVVQALSPLGAAVTLYGRDGRRAGEVAAELGVTGAARPVPPGSWDLLVNATPVGTFPDVGVNACPEAGPDGAVVYDLVYNPPDTALLRSARAAGCRTIGGLDMLVSQARLQQEQWTGRRVSETCLREAAAWKLSTWTNNP